MMKRIWTGVFAAIVGVTTTVTIAQTTSSQSNSSSAERAITVTGCLKEAPSSSADATATGTAGAAGTAGPTGTAGGAAAAGATAADAAATQKFMLIDASRSPADTSGSAAAAGTTAPGAASASTQTYKLIANPGALSPHVGKKLELTGTVEDQTGATASSAGAEANASVLRVTSGKILADSCSQ